MSERKTFSNYKKNTIQAAKDLLYGPEVIKKLITATSEMEVVRIMANARNRL